MKEKYLVIVESPTKAKTIGRILGSNYSILSSMGHLIDLPEKELGVDIDNGFQPSYVVIPGRQKVLQSLKKESKDKDAVYVATDPDREGEAIGWQIKERLLKDKKVLRVVFHEITPAAILGAFKHPRDFDQKMVEAQTGRRILDRIVGYFLSPLLWKKIVRGLSAGRVQSVALKLIAEREKEIKNFLPQEYWEIEAELKKSEVPATNIGGSAKKYGGTSHQSQAESFRARLEKIRDKKIEIKNKKEAEKLVAELQKRKFIVAEIKNNSKRRFPYAPFITSTLQQEAYNKLRFNAAKTMRIAQQLYEGIDIGQENPVGLITYMRTDSPRIAPEAIQEVRQLIREKYGKKYLPDAPHVYKVKKLAQEAHEAIRPTLINRMPESLKSFLSPEQYKLYALIYLRFVASQMNPAEYLVTSVEIDAEGYLFVASGSSLIFEGFLAAYANNESVEEEVEKKKNIIPPLEKGEILALLKLLPSQHFTKPPPRFCDSSLVKALEEDGIGRPSTYAPIIQTLLMRDYVRRQKGYFFPTELGIKVSEMLVEYFPKIMDVKFTALMEEELDEIEEGGITKNKVLEDFYHPFKKSLDFAQKNIKKEVVKTEELCEKCGRPMVIKWGRKGKFLSCSGYPVCKNAKSITTGVKCPQDGCSGELIERRSRRGFFYGCSNYPNCRFVSRSLPGNPKENDAALS